MRILVLALSLVLNLILYVVGASLAEWSYLQIMAALAMLNFLVILIHELGHAWAFRFVGGSVCQIVVLFVSFDVKRRKIASSGLPPNGDVGGFVVGTFPAGEPTVRDQIIVSGAGPAANLLTGVAALMIIMLWPPMTFTEFIQHNSQVVEQPRPTEILADEVPRKGNVANLPTDKEMAAILTKMDEAVWSFALYQLVNTTLTLFAVLSIGMVLFNLLPYGGSDGQHILRALKMRRMAQRR